MKKMLVLLFTSLLFFTQSSFAAQPSAGHMVAVTPANPELLPYMLYLPEGYDSNKKYPMLLFMHGLGQRGNDLNKLAKTGLPKMIKAGQHYPFIIVMPQCPDDGPIKNKQSQQFWWKLGPIEKVKNILDHETKLRSVDENRLYVTGLSMGGFGTYKIFSCFIGKNFIMTFLLLPTTGKY